MTDLELIKSRIRTVPDWPKPGIQFRDITPVLQDAACLQAMVRSFVANYAGQRIDVVAGIDARGFILGSVIAHELKTGFVPVRKQGKLPYDAIAEEFELEYGTATLELHTDAVARGDRVLLVDDLIATGGTMLAATKLLARLGAVVVEGAAIVDLPELGGSQKLRDAGLSVFTLVEFGGH